MTASMIGCPLCAGVLAEVSSPDSSYITLACTVGHTFSLESVLEAKEEQMEQALWTAVVVAYHIDMVTTKLLEQPASPTFQYRQDELARRRAQVQAHVQHLRRLVEETSRPDLSPERRGAP